LVHRAIPGTRILRAERSKTPILKSPDLPADHTLFPYEVTFIEEMHQQEFWDAAVQEYDLHIFRSGVLPIGSKINYKKQPGGYNPTKPSRYQMPPHNNVATTIQKPTPTALLALTPQQRAASDYVEKLVQSAKYENTLTALPKSGMKCKRSSRS
jgi:hypothetical protein